MHFTDNYDNNFDQEFRHTDSPNSNNQPPEYSWRKNIEKDAENIAREHLKNIIERLNTGEPTLSDPNKLFELELIILEIYKNYYLKIAYLDYARELSEKNAHLATQIGSLKGGLKFWEGGKFTLIESMASIFQWVLKAGLSFVTVLSTVSLVDPNFKENFNEILAFTSNNLIYWICIFSGVSLIELSSASVYNWFTSYPSNSKSFLGKPVIRIIERKVKFDVRPEHFGYLIIIVIWLVEASLGYSILHRLKEFDLDVQRQYAKFFGLNELVEKSNEFDWALFFGVSMFALINLFYALSKAKRDNSVTERKDRLAALLEYGEKLKEEVDLCLDELETKRNDFDKYIARMNEILCETSINNSSNFIDELFRIFRQNQRR